MDGLDDVVAATTVLSEVDGRDPAPPVRAIGKAPYVSVFRASELSQIPDGVGRRHI